ncbi:hypothetical protein Tco_0351590 [Tanacetum coccineum]
MSQDVLLTVMKSTAIFDDSMNLEMKKSESCNKCLDLEAELVKRKNMVERDVYTELLNSFAKLEKHCISLELNIQLNQQIFQEDKSCNNQNALEILEYFENNDLKAQLQTKDTTICKLKERIKSMRENNKEEKVKQDMDEIETINIELEHSLSKLLSENGVLHKEIDHLKKIYKDRFDSIKKTRALSKEHCESLIAQLNFKSMENANLKGQIQKKVFVTTALQNELRRLKGKNVLDNDTIITNATTISPGMFKLDLDPLAPRLDMINQCFLGDSCEEILSSLERLAIEYYSKQGDKQSIVREPVSVDESGSELALDKLAIKAIIYIFRQSNIHPERSHKIVERDVEEHGDVKELKKAALQLSVIRPSKIWTKLSTRRVN